MLFGTALETIGMRLNKKISRLLSIWTLSAYVQHMDFTGISSA